ncbi:MAG: threonine synthase [Bacteroidota bacterium]
MASLICSTSGKAYPLLSARWHGEDMSLLDIRHDLTFQKADVNPDLQGMWRYRAAIPLPDETPLITQGEGWTPLIEEKIEGKKVWLKLDHLFPSGSYKDRGGAALITLAKAIGVTRVVQDSSGNAGCAVAHYGALAEISCDIFVPASTSPAKLAQIRAYGAKLHLVPGSREDTASAARHAASDTFYASHVWHPFFYEGTKTFAYEICEQLGWQAPDTVVLPAGNGTLLLGCEIGFRELQQAGIITHIPKLIGIQSANCAPLYQAFHWEAPTPNQSTVAEGIAIAAPLRADHMITAVRKTRGTFLKVTEEEIADTLRMMTGRGYFIEPTSAAVIAGLRQYLRVHAQTGETIVSVTTGHGLKAASKIEKILTGL